MDRNGSMCSSALLNEGVTRRNFMMMAGVGAAVLGTGMLGCSSDQSAIAESQPEPESEHTAAMPRRFICCEEHFGVRALEKEAEDLADPALTTRVLNPELDEFYYQNSHRDGLYDLDARYEFMEKNGVDMQIMSFSNTIPTNIPAEDGVRICKAANDEMHNVVRSDPDRFAAFAILPWHDPQAAADELERCVTELGCKGVLVDNHFNGHNLDEPIYEVVFAKLEELDVPLYLHPSFVDATIVDYYYKAEGLQPDAWGNFGSAAFGWHLDVGLQVIRLVLSGVFDKFPNLKLICGHWGEVALYYLARIDSMMGFTSLELEKSVVDCFKENIWVTPSAMLGEDQLQFVLGLIGEDHIMWSLDYPYVPVEGAHEIFESYSLTDEQKEKIAHGNAEKLFKL